jgi:hypothetical protein
MLARQRMNIAMRWTPLDDSAGSRGIFHPSTGDHPCWICAEGTGHGGNGITIGPADGKSRFRKRGAGVQVLPAKDVRVFGRTAACRGGQALP